MAEQTQASQPDKEVDITEEDTCPKEQNSSKLIIKKDSSCFLFNPLKRAFRVD